MAKNCINLESPEFKKLHQQLVAGVTFSDISPEVVGANIALWQDQNKTEEFPNIIELQDFMAAQTLLSAAELSKDTVLGTPLDDLPVDIRISGFEKSFKDPIERTNRINLITGLFGQYVSALIDRDASDRGVDISSINRLNFIKKYGPDRILSEVKELGIDPYITNGGNVDSIWGAVEANYPEFTEEQIEAEVLRIQEAYDKVAQYYWDIVVAARPRLRRSEGLKIKDTTEQEDVENNPKEQFGVDITTISGYESLSALSRHFLSTIPMVDQDGVYSLDDILQVRYLESDYTFSKIVELLPGTKSSSEMVDRLKDNIPLYPWLRGVVDRLSEDNNLATTLFSNMNKAFMPYDVMTKGGDISTLNINNTVRTFLNTVKRNLLNGALISKNAIYTSASKLDKTKIKDLLSNLTTTLKGYNTSRTEDYRSYLEEPSHREAIKDTISDAYRAVGFPVRSEDIGYLIDHNIEKLNPLSKVVAPLQNTLSKILKDPEVKDTADILQKYSMAFNTMADNFRFLSQSTESSIRIGDKTRYSYVLPSYLSDLMDDIKDDSKRESLFKDKFEKFPFFYNPATKTYYNDWLNILSTEGRTHMRANFRYKNMLHDDRGKEYSQWTVADYAKVVLAEFGSFIDTSKGEKPSYSGYMMPTMSDAGTVLFLQAPRYDSDITTYQDKILKHLESVVYQEITKINDIQDRAKRREAGEDIPTIEYYDNKPEFTFIPQLNSYREDGKSFIEKYQELQEDKTALSHWIQSVLSPIVEAEFDNFMTYLQAGGVFSDRVGKFPKDATGENSYQSKVTALEKAVASVDPAILEDTDIKGLFTRAKAVTITTPIGEILNISSEFKSTIEDVLDLDTSGLQMVSPLKEELRHFFWNDYLANIYMIQLLTTSTQFYGSDTKFYKRGKEWYAATRKLDTDVKATLKMAIVSDVDSVVPDQYRQSINNLYNGLIADGKITNDIKGRLMSSMEAINETDGEAFMTIDSYRDMMLASAPELWTEAHESVYQKQTGKSSAPLTPEESAIVFQIIKPFVYTQIDMSNGSKDPNLPLPFQNKNSIVVLTPSLVQGNEKLTGLLQFMNDNSLDMLQFESAVKVGIQGKMAIEGNTSKEIVSNLTSQYMRDGQVREGYSYTINARNFGIQQETPPHYLDSATNIAVQMKRITLSYMTPEAKAEADQITIENAKEAYIDLEKLYTEPGNLYRMISESLKDDGRASNDTIKAVTPDLAGNIPVPLCNPLTDGVIAPRVIAPFKQVIKQMISGGALIQATSLGHGVTVENSDDLGVKFAEDGSIEYIECLMPATYKEIIAPILNRETGSLDIDAKDESGNPLVPEDMRKIIAFRIPSEGANSVVPLRIKGFLPVSAGGMIKTNPLVFTLTGSDLDVDKLFFYKKAYSLKDGRFVEDKSGKTGRDNRYFDLLYKSITSLEYTKDMMITSNFEEQKRAARILEILSNPDIESKYKHLSVLEKMSTKNLTKLSEKVVSNVGGIASPVSKVTSAIRNMTGKNLIGSIANHSSNAVLLRDYPSPIDKKYHFSIDTVPFNMINVKNTYLAVKQYLAAVVDNAKDPVLGSLGAGEDTIQAVMTLVRAGFSPVQIGLLFNQPSFKAAITEYEKSGRREKLTKFLNGYKETLAKKMQVDSRTLDTSLTSNELVESINGLKERDPESYYRTQLKVLENFSRLFQVGDYLAEYVSVSRYDSSNSAPKVSVESIYSESLRVDNFYGKKPLVKLPKLTEAVYSGDQALKSIESDRFPVVKYIQAMYGLSYGGAISMLSRYYPQLNPYFSSIRNTIGISSLRKELSNKEIKTINSSIMEYLLSGKVFPIEQRTYFTEQSFERDLISAMNKDIVLKENYLLRNLTKLKGGTIGLEDSGAINSVARERFTDAWRGLVMSDNPTYKNLGLDLLRYCAYTYGVKYAPGSFIHLAPLEAQLLLPEYVSTLRNIEKDQYSDSQGFLPQFYLNNADSNNLVPEVPNVENVLFQTDDGVEDGFVLPATVSDTVHQKVRDILYPKDGRSPGAFKVNTGDELDIYLKYREVENSSGVSSYYKKVSPIKTKGATYAYGKTIEEFISLTTPIKTIEETEVDNTLDAFSIDAAQYEGVPENISVPFDIDAVDQIEEAISAMANLDFEAIEAAVAANLDSMPDLEGCNII